MEDGYLIPSQGTILQSSQAAYTIDQPLGRGVFSSVIAARTAQDQEVAIKFSRLSLPQMRLAAEKERDTILRLNFVDS